MQPNKLLERLQWFEQRIVIWKATPALVGLSPAQATLMDNAIKDARTAYDAVQATRNKAKAQTLTQTSAFAVMNSTGGDDIRFIRAFAESQATEAARNLVYSTAEIDPPAPPSPPGPPKAPQDVVGDPNADGTVTLKWKGSTASQTFFTVWRKTGNINNWTQVGSVASKSYVDTTVPTGAPSVSYYIKAQRQSEASQPSDEAVVNFGLAA